MTLSREHLQDETLKKLADAQAADGQPRALTSEELLASQNALMAEAPASDHVWVFGYGSLVWNPLFEYDRSELATLEGYSRRFCMKTQISRGTPEQPGLLLGLDPGENCQGIALRMTGAKMHEELALLWRREMLTGAYWPRWVDLQTSSESIRALAFVMNLDYPFYVNGLDTQQTAAILASAAGPLGTCSEYLFKTHEGLLARGINDEHMAELVERVKALQGTQE